MNSKTERLSIVGPAGALEVLKDLPNDSAAPQRGVAAIAHPHPLFGGTMDNKVVQTLARAFVQAGWQAVRFNFRGVGASEGAYDEGRGEVDDLLAVVQALAPQGELALAGFSFGCHVVSQALSTLWSQRSIDKLVLVGTAATRFKVPHLPTGSHDRALVIHGEDDDVVPLTDVMAWARPQRLPVLVVPEGGHFFHGQLPLLKSLVVRHLSSPNLSTGD